jgi:DNA-binding transcriptional LysR family regulator
VRYLAPLIPAFTEKHPKVTVDLGLNDRVVDLMDEGWDLTIRVGHLKDSRLISRKLAESTMIVCAAPAYWAKHGRPAHWADLQQHNCLGFAFTNIARPDEWFFGRNRERSVAVKGTLRANNGDALVAAAAAGLGVPYEPQFIVADAIRQGLLEEITLDQPAADLGGIHLVYSPDRSPPAKVRAMVDFLVAAFNPRPPWTLTDAAATSGIALCRSKQKTVRRIEIHHRQPRFQRAQFTASEFDGNARQSPICRSRRPRHALMSIATLPKW